MPTKTIQFVKAERKKKIKQLTRIGVVLRRRPQFWLSTIKIAEMQSSFAIPFVFTVPFVDKLNNSAMLKDEFAVFCKYSSIHFH